jgi:site-specific DNA recombinase
VLSQVNPIVSEELWARCNAILDERRDNRKRPARKPVHLFAGIAHCACGSKMYVPSNSPKYICYKCRNKIPITDLDGVFHEQLKGFVFSPTEIADHLKQADTTIRDKEELLQTLEKEQRETKQVMDKVFQAYIKDEISVEAFGREYRPLEARLKQLDDELPRLQGEVDFLKIQYLSSDEILAEARDLYTRWPSLAPEEKRHIVENVVERITIGKDDVTIDLCYLPSASEVMAEKQRNFRDSSRRRA